MATTTTSLSVSLKAKLASGLSDEQSYEENKLAPTILEAGIPALPDGLELLLEQHSITGRGERKPASIAQHRHEPRNHVVVGSGRQVSPQTPPASSSSPACEYGQPTTSVEQGFVAILTPRDSINRTSESSSVSAAPSSTFERLIQTSSVQSGITNSSSRTSIAPATSKLALSERAFQKSPESTQDSKPAPKHSKKPTSTWNATTVIAGTIPGDIADWTPAEQKNDDKQSLKPSVVCIDRKYYVSTDMEIPSEVMKIWGETIKARLEDVLYRESRATWDSEAALVLEFYMVGTKSKNLKPSIMITCCSSKRKKDIKSCLGGLKWLKDSGLRYFIRVDKTFGHRMNGRHVEHPLIEARLLPELKTLCGIAAQIRTSGSPALNQAPVKFTLGGLVYTDQGLGCMTAGHPFLPPVDKKLADVSDSETSGSVDDDDYSDSDGSLWGHESLDGDLPENPDHITNDQEVIDQDQPISPPCRFRPFLHRGLISHFASPHSTSELLPNRKDAQDRGNPDWVVFLMTKYPAFLLQNSIHIPGTESPTCIEGVCSGDHLTSGPVFVAAGSGLQRGYLSSNPASVLLWSSFRDVRQITLERSLGRCSPIIEKFV